jgi:hypothetical protein
MEGGVADCIQQAILRISTTEDRDQIKVDITLKVFVHGSYADTEVIDLMVC